jgi:AraC-like DNA-binding protein
MVIELASTTSFSTIGIPPEHRLIRWQEYNSRALMELRCVSLKPAEFEGATTNLQLTQTHLAHIETAAPSVIERRPKTIRQRPAEAIYLQFVLAGEAFIYHSDGVRTLRPGQLLVCDADQPFIRGFSAGYEELFLKVSRPAFHQSTGLTHVEAPLFKPFSPGHGGVAALLAEQVEQALRRSDGQLPDEQELLRLVGAMWRPDMDADSSTYLAIARSFVDSRLSDATLGAADIAAAVGISPRHLSRVFGRTGSTVPQYVLRRRLEVARNMLERTVFASMTIAELSARCGFRSSAYFSSAFTARFGQRPSDFRRMAPHYRKSSLLSQTA